MKKLATLLVGVSMSTAAFADGAKLQIHCYEQVLNFWQNSVLETKNLYKGEMPLGQLRLPSRVDSHNNTEYFLDFSANNQKGPKLEIVMPEPAAPAEQQKCQVPQEEVIPGECVEVPGTCPAPEQEKGTPAQEQDKCGKSGAKDQVSCPVEAVDTASINLFMNGRFNIRTSEAKDSSSASLAKGETVSLKIDHHRGHAGLKVNTVCDVLYLGEN